MQDKSIYLDNSPYLNLQEMKRVGWLKGFNISGISHRDFDESIKKMCFKIIEMSFGGLTKLNDEIFLEISDKHWHKAFQAFYSYFISDSNKQDFTLIRSCLHNFERAQVELG